MYTVDFEYVPQNVDFSKDQNPMFHWRATVKTSRGSFTTDYRQGIAHQPQVRPKDTQRHTITIYVAERLAAAFAQKPFGGSAVGSKPRLTEPKTDDVLACLFSDASFGLLDFADFCSNVGYDTDSIKARDTHNACRETYFALHRIFTDAEYAELKEKFSNW